MQNARLNEAQVGIKIGGRNINNLRFADDTTIMAESKEELKSLLMKVKEKSEKPGLKLNIQKSKTMASGPITSWQTEKQWKQGQTLSFWAPKSLQMVTATMKLKDTCSLEEKLWPSSLSLVFNLCPPLVTPMDCSLPGSSVHRILQARILEWFAISFSTGSFRPRNWT